MRSSLTSSPIPPFLLRPFLNPKSLSPQPHFPNILNSPVSPLSEGIPPLQNPTFSESKHDPLTSPASETKNLTRTYVINTLVSYKNDPITALNCFNRVEQARGPTSIVLIDHLVECAKRFDLLTDLLNSYVVTDRINDALECCHFMIERDICPRMAVINILLTALVRRNLIHERKELYNKMVLRGVSRRWPINVVVATSLVNGYCKQGDLSGALRQNTIRNHHNGGYRESSRSKYQNNIGGQGGKFSGYYGQNNLFLKQKPSGVYWESLRGFKQNSSHYRHYHQSHGVIYAESTECQNNTFQQTGNFSGYDWVNNGEPQKNLAGAQAQMPWGGQYNPDSFFGGNASMQNSYGSFQESLGKARQNLNRFDSQTWSKSHGSVNGSFMQNIEQYQQNSSDSTYQLNQNTGQYWSDQSLGQYQQNPNVGNHLPNSNHITNAMVASQVVTYPKPDEELAEASENSQNNVTLEELDSFVKEGKVTEAVEVLGLVDKQYVPVDLPRLLQLMQACGEAKALQEAKAVHEYVVRLLSPLKVSTYNRILKMYSECGSMDDAFDVFNKMGRRNLTSWDTMITGFAKNGQGEDAVDLFSQFKQAGLKPDGQMFIGVFSACSVLGDINEGMLHFESMIKDYDIVPSMKHYMSIVDMLGSTGYLDEALEFIEKMPMEPTVDVWERLMNLCRIHGNLELGDHCAEFVEQLDPSRLNEKSKAGLVPVETSDLTREKEKKKLASQNLLEVRSRVHEYRAGDTSHPETDRIYAQIRGLKAQMKEAGYIAETRFVLHDIDQEGKEEALLAHSERLAVSHGLLSSPARAPIRIIKNLRVCGDCHTALKIISKIVGRELIIRDAKRFHHFKDGLCSCRDYW